MKKLTFILLLFFALNINTKAQDATIAKYKFEEAEEAYNAEKYKVALTKLDEVEKLLGKTYEKTLYLRIMALDKLIWSGEGGLDINNIVLLQKNYTDYLKTFEGQTEEEKYRDIYKISEKYNKRGIPPSLVNNALTGSAEDCYKMGRFYSKWNENERALDFFRLSANKKHPKACVRMGAFYNSGYKIIGDNPSDNIEIPKDAKKALDLFEAASRQNDWEADAFLGYMYYFGSGVTKDEAKAEQYCKRVINNSAGNYNKENDIGSYFMGIFYEFGIFVEKNNEQAMYWYKNVPLYSFYSNNAQNRFKSLQDFYENIKKGDEFSENQNYDLEKRYDLAIDYYIKSFEIFPEKDIRNKIALASLRRADALSTSNSGLDDIESVNLYNDAISYSINKDNSINAKLEEKLFQLYSGGKSNRVPKDGYYSNQPLGIAYISLFPEGKYIQIVKSEVEQQLYNFLKSNRDVYEPYMRYSLLRYIYLFPNGKYVEKAKTTLQEINNRGLVKTTLFGLTLEKYQGDESLLQNKFIIQNVDDKVFISTGNIYLTKNSQVFYITHIDGIPVDDLTLPEVNSLLTKGPFPEHIILITYKEAYPNGLILTKNQLLVSL